MTETAAPRSPKARPRRLKWVYLLLGVAALVALAFLPRGHKVEIPVEEEFQLNPVIAVPKIGPIDLSITKAVIYLWITLGVICVLAFFINRVLKAQPGRFQFAMETLYDLARGGIVESVMKSGQATWFPYIGGAFLFVLVSNLVGLIPLPFGVENQLAFYAATSTLNVTIMLALCTFVFTHYAGVRKNGLKYFANWAPGTAPAALKPVLWGIHAISEVFRLVSLSVRLFANMLAGHAILAVFFAMALIFQSYLIAVALQGASVLIYLFEIFVAFIQAFIFAILSAVYIGGALDQEH